jgi:hypothetical protein
VTWAFGLLGHRKKNFFQQKKICFWNNGSEIVPKLLSFPTIQDLYGENRRQYIYTFLWFFFGTFLEFNFFRKNEKKKRIIFSNKTGTEKISPFKKNKTKLHWICYSFYENAGEI